MIFSYLTHWYSVNQLQQPCKRVHSQYVQIILLSTVCLVYFLLGMLIYVAGNTYDLSQRVTNTRSPHIHDDVSSDTKLQKGKQTKWLHIPKVYLNENSFSHS